MALKDIASGYGYTDAHASGNVYTQDGMVIDDAPTQDANTRKATVAHGTPMPDWVTSRAAEFPSAEFDTWYYPTQMAYLIGNLQAAWTTAQELPQRAADTFEALSDGGKWIVAGLGFLVLLEILKRK